MSTIVRTAEEIVARIEEVKGADWLGTEITDLVVHLPFEQAASYLKPEVTRSEWDEDRAKVPDVHDQAVEYLDFAIGKIVDHRGISAGRSVSHFRAWLWLLFPDEDFARFENARYTNYGAPQIKVAAQMLGAEAVWNAAVEADPGLARMAEGDACEPGCYAGCGA